MGGLLPALAAAEVLGLLAADRASDLRPSGAGSLWVALALLLAAGALGTRWRRSGVAALSAGFFCLGLGLLGERLDGVDSAPRPLARDVTVEASVADIRGGDTWIALELEAIRAIASGLDEAGPPARVPARVLLEARLDEPGADWLAGRVPGERIRARLRLRPTDPRRNPGDGESPRGLHRRGVAARASLVDPRLAVVLPELGRGVARFSFARRGLPRLAAARRLVAQRLTQGTDGRVAEARARGGALLAALGLGHRRGLDEADRAAFVRLGLAHLLAVSGLHLLLVSSLGYLLARFVLLRGSALGHRLDVREPALVCALGLALVYAVATGWRVPVRRALIFLGAVGIAQVARRPVPAANVLALASIAVFSLDPAALFQPGTLLSFSAAGALLMARPLRASPRAASRAHRTARTARWLIGGLRSGLSTTALAIAVTSPLLAAMGVRTGIVGLVSNLVAVPWTACVLLPAAVTAALVCALAPHRLAWVVELACALGTATLRGVGWLASRLPDLAPQPAVTTGAVVFALALASATLLARRVRWRVLLAVGVLTWLAVAPTRRFVPAPPRVVVFDVGQGDAVLVQGLDAVLLVDAGRALAGGFDVGRSVVEPSLAALGVGRIDVLAASHADLDHQGGLATVLARREVGVLWLPRGGRGDPAFARLVSVARRRHVPVLEMDRRMPRQRVGDLEIEILWPPHRWRASRSRNEHSLVLRVSVAGHRILLTGDIGASTEAALARTPASLRSQILKVAHHGSRGSTTPDFLAAVDPVWALVSAPCRGRGGLPDHAILRRLEDAGIGLAWTGRDGALLLALGSRTASAGRASAERVGLRARALDCGLAAAPKDRK